MKLSTKVLLTITPLFLIAVGVSVYMNYRSHEQLIVDQAQAAARASAATIKESLVQMMITNLQVDDEYLEQIAQAGDVENIQIQFMLDSLHLRSEYLSEDRIERLRRREERVLSSRALYTQHGFADGQPSWHISCAMNVHPDHPLPPFSSTKPLWLSPCEQLKVSLPLIAEAKCQRCHSVPKGYVLGAVSMDIPFGKTIDALRANAAQSLGLFGIFTLVALAIGVLIFRAFVWKPVSKLVAATEVIGTGNLEHSVAQHFGKDEFGQLALAFENMQERLKKAQEELLHKERLSSVGRMASSIIHDFRNPMGIIFLSFDLLRNVENQPEEKRRELYDRISAELHRMNRMTQDILEFSRGEMQLDLQEWNIPSFTQAIEESVNHVLHKRKIAFEPHVRYTGNAVFDKDRLQRALINLINNAEEAMPRGGHIAFESGRDNGMVVFRVRDSGPGIPPAIRDRVFDPFVTSGKKKGTGLGLAITKMVVEKHAGDISFESVPGNGTTFTVRIPVTQPSKGKSV